MNMRELLIRTSSMTVQFAHEKRKNFSSNVEMVFFKKIILKLISNFTFT